MKKGISLAVLVVTIIVLVILTAVTVATITGENGVIGETQTAVADAKQAKAKEYVDMEMSAVKIKAAKVKENVYEYLTDVTEGATRREVLEEKGIIVDTTETNSIKCTYNGYEIVYDANGNGVYDSIVLNEDIPEMPEILEMPEMPEIPERPEIPEMPEIPERPNIPDRPSRDKTPKISLAEARSKIDKCVESAIVMESIMEQLSAEDQCRFTADVMKAINDMPSSIENKTAISANTAYACIDGAAKGNETAILAELYATSSPESLIVLSEMFSEDILNESKCEYELNNNGFSKIACDVMEKCTERCEETDNGSARATFMILTLVRAANGNTNDLTESLINCLAHEEAQEMARDEWIPSALDKNYASILASADVNICPDITIIKALMGAQEHDNILADLSGKNTDPMSFIETRTPIIDAIDNKLVPSVPNLPSSSLQN